LPPRIADLYTSAEEKEAAAAAAAGAKGKKGKGKDADEGFEPNPEDPYPNLTVTYMNALKLAGEAGKAEIVALGGTVDDEEPKGGKDQGKCKGKGKGKDKAEEEPPAELSEEAKVLQNRITTQNEILVRRLRRLRKYGLASLDELQIFAQGVYSRFSQTVSSRLKGEATCISSLGSVARGAIERFETLAFHLTVAHEDRYRFPLLLELALDTDLTLDSGLRLIAETAPPPTPVVEKVDEEGIAFSPDQLVEYESQLSSLANTGGAGSRRGDMVITSTCFTEAMHRFACDDFLLPEKWQELGRSAWVKMAKLFDEAGTGTVDGASVMQAVTNDAAGVLGKISA